MKVLHITYRYGRDIYGGAELYFREISEELVRHGVQVDVCTTKTTKLQSLFHSSVLFDNEQNDEQINGVSVFRFSVRNPNRIIAQLFERLYHWQVSNEEYSYGADILDTLVQTIHKPGGGFLVTGWNPIERHAGGVMRWTKKEAVFVINDDSVNSICCRINNPAGLSVTLVCTVDSVVITEKKSRFRGMQNITISCPDVFGKIVVKIICNHTMIFVSDHRRLGVSIEGISYRGKNGTRTVNMEWDYRDYLKQSGEYLNYLICTAKARPRIFSVMFDYMRGPNSTAMRRWLQQNIHHYDIVLAQMFPFNTIKYALEATKQNIPLVFLPLMHVDDEFYHWSHYYSTLQKADVVLALSQDSKKRFYDKIVQRCVCVGAGINKEVFLNSQISGRRFREQYHFGSKPIVLTVSRKNSSKKYSSIIRAMEKVRTQIPDAILVMIGPDDDSLPISSEYVHYLGKVNDSDLADGYDACSLFVMMSESESFGMVFCEAWSRKKPVIGNRNCKAVTSIINNGADGLLCSDEEELSSAVIRLLSDPLLSHSLGTRGYEKVLDAYTWEIVTEKISSIYTELSK